MHQIVQNAQKFQFRVQWGGSGVFVAKNSDTTSWHELLHYFGHFAPSFVRKPNGPECTQIVQNATKHQFRVRWGVSGAFVAKNSNATSWHKLLHKFGFFAPSFLRQPNGPECTQIVRNTPERQFRVQCVFVANNSDVTS